MLDYQGVMIDIETLGTKPGCVVLSIGACEFSDKGIGTEFYASIHAESCTHWGLSIEPRTVMWWFDQSQDARDFLTKGQHVDLDVALDQLRKAFKWKGKEVWCNGASFDFPILTAAHEAVGKNVPWEYWSTNDYRTVKNMVGRHVYDACKTEASVKHNALADAIAQAETLIKMRRQLHVVPAVQEPVKKGAKRAA